MKINELKTPCYVIDEGKLTENLKILHHVMQRTGAKILLAQKAFSAFCEYPLIGKYLSGTILFLIPFPSFWFIRKKSKKQLQG